MTREEKQKAIDALKISTPFMAVTQEEFNDYIQIRNQVMDWLEQQPCDDYISRQDLLDGIEELKQSPWFKNGEDKQDTQHYGYLERKEAVEVVTDLCIKKEPSAWIPVKYRDMTQEEIERYSEYTEATKMFDCKMPDDGQDILVSTRSGIVTTDVCDIDDMYGYGLEDYGDWEDILAWMPLPEPYKEAAGHDKSQ